MNRGETVPYILEADYPFMKFLEVDINFSLDYKPTDGESVRGMLQRRLSAEKRIADIESCMLYPASVRAF